MKIQILPAVLATVLFLCSSVLGSPPKPLLEILFNDSDGLGGIAGGAAGASGTFLDDARRPADLLSGDGEGVSGKPGDRCFDNSRFPAGEAGGVARFKTPADAPPTAASFTFTAWIKPAAIRMGSRDGSDRGGVPRLFKWGTSNDEGIDIRLPRKSLGLASLDDDTSVAELAAGPKQLLGRWLFVAVVYDGKAAAGDQVRFFRGSPGASLEPVASRNDRPVPAQFPLPSGDVIGVGNAVSGGRAFSGSVDNVRLFVSGGDSSAALGEDAIRAIFEADQTNPTLAP